jgi:hypothetical protein
VFALSTTYIFWLYVPWNTNLSFSGILVLVWRPSCQPYRAELDASTRRDRLSNLFVSAFVRAICLELQPPDRIVIRAALYTNNRYVCNPGRLTLRSILIHGCREMSGLF